MNLDINLKFVMANKRKQQSSNENKTVKKTKNSNEKETQLNQMYGMNVYSHIEKFYEFCKVHNPDSPKGKFYLIILRTAEN